jgi:hypothetical protein
MYIIATWADRLKLEMLSGSDSGQAQLVSGTGRYRNVYSGYAEVAKILVF